jgi:hypothetical protein
MAGSSTGAATKMPTTASSRVLPASRITACRALLLGSCSSKKSQNSPYNTTATPMKRVDWMWPASVAMPSSRPPVADQASDR